MSMASMSDAHQARSSPLSGGFTVPEGPVALYTGGASTVHHILACLSTAVLFLVFEWRLSYVSLQSDPLLACTRETHHGKTFWEVFPEASDSPVFRSLRDALTAPLPVEHEVYHPLSHKQHLESDPPDLTLLDVLWQGENGRDLCRQVKGREETRHIPVVLISAHVAGSLALEI